MGAGEWLTRATVWLALVLYAGSEAMARRQACWCAARWLNTFGCAAFLAHVACAFHFYHDWSHSAAYAATALQTSELVGWNWGGGLYINYCFALVWIGEVGWSWITPARYEERPRWITWTVRGVFLFMILNGGVVFANGIARLFGVVLCAVLIYCWRRNRDRIIGPINSSKTRRPHD